MHNKRKLTHEYLHTQKFKRIHLLCLKINLFEAKIQRHMCEVKDSYVKFSAYFTTTKVSLFQEAVREADINGIHWRWLLYFTVKISPKMIPLLFVLQKKHKYKWLCTFGWHTTYVCTHLQYMCTYTHNSYIHTNMYIHYDYMYLSTYIIRF